MKQKDVFKKIGGIIQELSDQYEYLKTVEDDLNDLELELFVANAHFLTDHIEILCKLNLQNRIRRPQVIEKTEKTEKAEPVTYRQKFFEPVVQQMKHGAGEEEKSAPAQKEAPAPLFTPIRPVEMEIVQPVEEEIVSPVIEEPVEPVDNEPVAQIDLSSSAAGDSYAVLQEAPDTIRHELILDEADTWEDEDEQAANAPVVLIPESKEEPLPLSEVMPAEPVEAELTTEPTAVPEAPAPKEKTIRNEPEEVQSINQKMSLAIGNKASKTEQIGIKPISDIKLAITLNDKLLYVKDLFNGYNLAYSEAIEILNRFSTFEEAQRFLKTNYVTKNNWDNKPATTEKFYALLRRRYA